MRKVTRVVSVKDVAWKQSVVIDQITSIGAGLVIGLLTGFFFERRSTKAARKYAKELEEKLVSVQDELGSVRRSVYSMGGTEVQAEPTEDDTEGLVEQLRRRALAI